MSDAKERPILFSGPMVRAILDGRKTQTRRVINPQPASAGTPGYWYPNVPLDGYGKKRGRNLHYAHEGHLRKGLAEDFCRYKPGDRLWVREGFRYKHASHYKGADRGAQYRANGEDHYLLGIAAWANPCWQPSIHMPRWASRITLEITGVRVERLQDISQDDAGAEGVQYDHCEFDDNAHAFMALWDSINAKRAPWSSNPWVWVVEFKQPVIYSPKVTHK